MVVPVVGFALVAMVAWGLWAVLADVATRPVQPSLAVIVSCGASVVLVLGESLPLRDGLGVAFGIAAVASLAG